MKKIATLLIILFAAYSAFPQCAPPIASAYLDVNNVRARMNVGGSSWWDAQSIAQYEVPAGSGKHSFYAGSFWIGGLDEFDVPHVAAMRFGQNGQDFWPGPLDENGQVDSTTCSAHDRIYKLNRWEVDEARERYNQVGYVMPQDILEWPAEGNLYADVNAGAPFRDVNNDGVYNAFEGDYPAFAFDEPVDKDFHLLGDQCLWWVENDNGNMHTETNAEPLVVELKCMAYAFATCNALNDQTFYRYTITNKSSIAYHDTYVGVWVDADIGFAEDDYLGCEVMRHLGYAYNGFEIDGTGGPQHYGAHPPAAGIGVLEGPLADENDGVDNDRDGVIDESGEHNMMSHYSSFTVSGGVIGVPPTFTGYYNNLRGIWADGTPMCYGETGHPIGGCNTAVPAQFLFPGDSDPLGYGTEGVPQPVWTEQTAGNPPLDRRFLVSSGPFDFDSGDTDIIHYGALWARDTNDINDPFSSAEALFLAKDYCQEKFEDGFSNLDCCPPVGIISQVQISAYENLFSSPEEGTSYLWDFGDGTTSTERFPPLHEYSDDEEYTVTLVVTNSCGSESTTMQAGVFFFGLDEPKLAELISIYPNPTNGSISLSVSNPAIKLELLKVYNAVGSLVYSDEDLLGQELELNAKPGIYLVLLQTNKGSVSKKLLVN
ncbi:MAG: hypothetical protein ACI9UR_002048 [Bacteroidia bacterium]|jgi:hypothetical protein